MNEEQYAEMIARAGGCTVVIFLPHNIENVCGYMKDLEPEWSNRIKLLQ